MPLNLGLRLTVLAIKVGIGVLWKRFLQNMVFCFGASKRSTTKFIDIILYGDKDRDGDFEGYTKLT